MLGFLHTADVHVRTFGDIVDATAPDVRPVHRVDAPLLDDARAGVPVSARVARHLRALRDTGARVVVCTCSTLGPVAERLGEETGIPVLRVDLPMAQEAVRDGGRVAVVVALGSTLAPTTDLLHDAATRAGTRIELVPVVCTDAWAAFEAGDLAEYHRAVADAARAAVLAPAARPDVVVLAQASMAPAAALLTDVPVRVLTSPGSAVARAVETIRATGGAVLSPRT